MYLDVFRMSIFGNFKQYRLTIKNAMFFTEKIKEKGYEFLPTLLPIQPANGVMISGDSQGANDDRMRFVSLDRKIMISILEERLDIEFIDDKIDDLKKEFDDKINKVIELMELMLELLGNLKGTRLAYYVDLFIPEAQENAFAGFYNKYDVGIKIINSEEAYTEWSHMFNKRSEINIGEKKSEKCNVIFFVESRFRALPEITERREEKGLFVSADINTLVENPAERFTSKEFECFLHGAQNLFFDIFDQLKAKLF